MNNKSIIWLTAFSIAMGYMESAVVIYLRKIYYPNGFQFPLAPLDPAIGLVEVFREAATIIMLWGIATITAKTASLKFATFLLCFAIWDLFYYIFLWIFLSWPQSLFTWDILFLIPVPWVGPVITPCIISITMILLSLTIFHFQKRGLTTKLNPKEWLLLSTGSLVIVLSFIWDYLNYITNKSSQIANPSSPQNNPLSELKDYIPNQFNWPLFLIGQFILLFAIILFINRLQKQSSPTTA